MTEKVQIISKISLKQIYAYLYYKFKDKDIDFNEISNNIEIDRSIPSRLTNHGYAISFYDVVDYRKKRYHLVSPADEAFATGFLTELKNNLKINKFKNISINTLFFKVLRNLRNKLNYLVGGIQAFNYYVPNIIGKTYNLIIFKEDLDKFYSIIAKININPYIVIDNRLINQKNLESHSPLASIILNCSLTEEYYNSACIRDELPIISPEYLILDFLIRDEDLYYIFSLILTQDIDFQLLVHKAKQNGVIGKILFLIHALEKVLNKPYFFHEQINEMKPKTIVAFIDFPHKPEFHNNSLLTRLTDAQIQALKADELYFSEEGKEWGIKSFLKKSQVDKVIEDINKESWSKFWK